MKLRLLSFGVLLLMLSAFALPSATAAKLPLKGQDPFANIPITGTVTQGGAGAVNGLFTIDHFEVRNTNELWAVGTFTGTVGALKAKDTPLALPATLSVGSTAASIDTIQAMAVCPILTLSLGPLDLDLLGLQVHLDEVNLDITAVSGQGNLLGNLLCAVAGLLDPLDPTTFAGLLQQIVDLLNAIIPLFR